MFYVTENIDILSLESSRNARGDILNIYIRYEYKGQIDHNDQIVQSGQMSQICQIGQMGY